MIQPVPHVEVGHAIRVEPRGAAAGAEAAHAALASIRIHRPRLALVFASTRHDVGEVLQGVRSALGDVPVLGGSTAGEIRNGFHRGGVAVSVVATPYLSVRIGAGADAAHDWASALDEALSSPDLQPFCCGDVAPWRVLAGRGAAGFALVLAPGGAHGGLLLEAMHRRLPDGLPVLGLATTDALRPEGSFVLAGDRAVPQGLAVALFETELRFGIATGPGPRPSVNGLHVTAARGRDVLELDGRPAADAYAELLGVSRQELERTPPASGRIVARPPGPLGPCLHDLASYVTSDGAVRFAVPLPAGTVLLRMRADPDTSTAAGRAILDAALASAGVPHPALALVSHCCLPTAAAGEAAARCAGVTGALVIGDELSEAALESPGRLAPEAPSAAARAEQQAAQAREAAEREAQRAAAVDLRARQADARRREQRAVRALVECSVTALRADEEQVLLEAVCRTLVDVGGYSMSWVGLAAGAEAPIVEPAAAAGPDGHPLGAPELWAGLDGDSTPVATAIRTGRTVLVSDVGAPTASPWRARMAARGHRAVLAIPLTGKGSTFGAIGIGATEAEAFDRDRITLLTELAEDLAAAVTGLRERADRTRSRARTEAENLLALGALAAGDYVAQARRLAASTPSRPALRMLGRSRRDRPGGAGRARSGRTH